MQPTQLLDTKLVLTGSLELADKSWKVALTDGRRLNPAVFSLDAMDLWGCLEALLQRLQEFKRKWGMPADCQVVLIHEAGQDGFWIARALEDKGVRVLVVDAASVQVTRHAKRKKTDRIDALKLLEELRAWLRGERMELRVLHIPSEEQEAQRLLSRERGQLQKEMNEHRDRTKKLLRTLGCRAEVDSGFAERLLAGEVRRADGRPIPEQMWQRLLRECERLDLAKRQFADVQHTLLHQLPDSLQRCIAQLARLQGVGWVGAMRLVLEFFWRDFTNRRQVGSCLGLVPQPFNSGETVTDQGISKQGNRRVRSLMIELAWMWMTYQPDSAVAKWFAKRTSGANKRGRRIAIVAAARKLAVELWRYLRHGVMPDGAKFKAA